MNVHEYQAKELLAKYGVPVQPGGVAYTAAEAEAVAKRLGGQLWAVKAQIHAGGRGKAGGVKLVKSPEEAGAAAGAMLGKRLVTHQTGPQGRDVKRVYVEAASDIARELYLALSVDRTSGRTTLIAAAEGGVEIEELAARAPDKILQLAIDPATGIEPFHSRRLAFELGLGAGEVLHEGSGCLGLEYLQGPVGSHPLGCREPQHRGNERSRRRLTELVQVRAVLPAQLDHVRESGRGDQRGARRAALQQGIGRHRHSVGEALDILRAGPGAGEDEPYRIQHAGGLLSRGGGNLGRCNRGVLAQENRVGERPADIDSQEHPGSLREVQAAASSRFSVSARCWWEGQ